MPSPTKPSPQDTVIGGDDGDQGDTVPASTTPEPSPGAVVSMHVPAMKAADPRQPDGPQVVDEDADPILTGYGVYCGTDTDGQPLVSVLAPARAYGLPLQVLGS